MYSVFKSIFTGQNKFDCTVTFPNFDYLYCDSERLSSYWEDTAFGGYKGHDVCKLCQIAYKENVCMCKNMELCRQNQ